MSTEPRYTGVYVSGWEDKPPSPQTIPIPEAENLEDALRRGTITDLIMVGVFETEHLDQVREALADE